MVVWEACAFVTNCYFSVIVFMRDVKHTTSFQNYNIYKKLQYKKVLVNY